MRYDGQSFWIIGASEGLGRALAHALDAQGASLVLSARSHDRLRDLAGGLRDARAVAMDVSDKESVIAAAASAGPVDGVIYCVGLYDPMGADEWDADKVEQMFDGNLMGAVRVLGQVVPDMVARGAGRIMLIGSLSGHRGLPGAIGYGAAKAGLIHLAENMRVDLLNSDVRVQIANPGFIKTRLTDKNDFTMPQIMTADKAAAYVMRALASGRFATNFPAPFAWLFTLGKHLPLSWFQKIFAR